MHTLTKSFEWGGSVLSFSLEMDSSEKIVRFHSHGLEVLKQKVLGKDVDFILKMKTESFFDPYLFFLREAIYEYRNSHIRTNVKKNLLCRCFNVSRDEIFTAIQNSNLSSVREVTDSLKAGGGCTHCLPDIQQIFVKSQGGSSSKGNRSG